MNVILLGLDENNRFAVRRFFVVLYDDHVRDSETIIIMRCVSRNFKPVRTLYISRWDLYIYVNDDIYIYTLR